MDEGEMGKPSNPPNRRRIRVKLRRVPPAVSLWWIHGFTLNRLTVNGLRPSGFTLVEVMIVMAVIGIISSISFFYLNPFEYFKKAHDAQRFQNLNSLKGALVLAIEAGKTFAGRCTPVSPCSSLTGSNVSDGTGWIDLDLSKYLSSLPRDPLHPSASYLDGKGVNSPATFQFAAVGLDFEIRTRLESKFFSSTPNDKYLDDGGDDSDYFEIGTRLNIL